MQRKAAIWILGAFRTSPTGGVEALAGLMPINLHLRKLAARSACRIVMLSDAHPLRSILSEANWKTAVKHPLSLANMDFKAKSKSPNLIAR